MKAKRRGSSGKKKKSAKKRTSSKKKSGKSKKKTRKPKVGTAKQYSRKGGKKVYYTKKGQPYIRMANGKARFIKK